MADRSVFAGSVALANWLVRTMVSLADVDVVNAVKMASLTPARILGIDNAKGSISRGKDADLVVFDDDFAVWLTMVEGDTVFSKLE